MAPKHTQFTASPIGVKEVAIDKLRPNPHNPRMLFDRQPMAVLRDSIKRVGILVPLTVYQEAKGGHFIILDGQRRWMCAQEVGLPKVPVNQVQEPSLVQNIVTMFQIHKLREDWELMPTALKIQLLMEEINDRNDARLAELTGLDESVIVRCKKLLSFDRQFQDMMLDPDPEKRVKADFFIELYPVVHDRDVRQFEWFAPKQFTRQMLVKYQETPKTIKAVTDFRLVKQHVTNARRINSMDKFSKKLKVFAEVPETPLEDLEIQEASVHAEARALVKKIDAVEQLISTLDTDEFYGEEALWESMAKLVKVLNEKLRKADKKR